VRRLPALILSLLVGAAALALCHLAAGPASASSLSAASGVCRNQFSGPNCGGSTQPAAGTPGVANSEVSSIASSLTTPTRAFGSVKSDVVDAVIAVGLFPFIMFPANLFNSTFEENYADIAAWWEKWTALVLPVPLRRAVRNGYGKAKGFLLGILGLAGRSKEQRLEREQVTFIAVLLVGALLGAMLDPWFGPNFRTVVLYLAILIALLAGVTLSALMTLGYHRARKHGKVNYKLEALPVGLAIAVVCVVISRATGFRPGYLYGVICGVSFGRKLAKDEEGHVIALSAWLTVGVATLAWLAWATITDDANKSGSFLGTVFLDDFLASLFVSALVGTVISLFPLKFLPGHKLQSWHKGAWAATFLGTLFVMVQVLLRPYSGPSGRSHVPLVTTIVLFVLFAGGSLLFHEHFVRKGRLPAAASAAEATIGPDESEGLASRDAAPSPDATARTWDDPRAPVETPSPATASAPNEGSRDHGAGSN
jgi:hypothetical protein